jgi:hypothetical protein
MPPLQALAALHGFWIMVVLVPTVAALRGWPAERLRTVGAGITLLGGLALALASAVDMGLWLAAAPAESYRYIPQRVLFFLATLTAFPLLQITGAGAVAWWVGLHRSCRL